MFPAKKYRLIVILLFVLVDIYLLIDFHLATSVYFGLAPDLVIYYAYWSVIFSSIAYWHFGYHLWRLVCIGLYYQDKQSVIEKLKS